MHQPIEQDVWKGRYEVAEDVMMRMSALIDAYGSGFLKDEAVILLEQFTDEVKAMQRAGKLH